ncbi:UNVERIFIED_ORG: hypothetical protein Xoosp15_35 [Xanthomonas phage Xoo-sp15]
MVKAEEFEQYMESSGLVSDPEFGTLTDLLSKLPVVDTDSTGGLIFASETSVYATTDGKYLRLTYQVRTPKTPKGMKYTYYFGEA